MGPNGAGKTTTIRMLTTLLAPTSGTALVAGHDVTVDPLDVRRSIGVVPQMLNLDIDLTCAENLEYHGRLHKMEPADRDARIEELLRFVGLWEKKDTPVEHLSGGMRRRLLIARGLMHRPQVVFMDEPTVGLDPQARRMIWGLMESLKRKRHHHPAHDALYRRGGRACATAWPSCRPGRIIALDRPSAEGRRGKYSIECLGGTMFRASSSPRGKRRSMRAAVCARTSLCANQRSKMCSST